MTAHEIVIRFGRRFDIRTSSGAYLAGISEITVPFADRESAEAAQREITVHVRPVHDAGGEDYRPWCPVRSSGNRPGSSREVVRMADDGDVPDARKASSGPGWPRESPPPPGIIHYGPGGQRMGEGR